jgi:hypothetical protein
MEESLVDAIFRRSDPADKDTGHLYFGHLALVAVRLPLAV